jgi:hypothetical protein
MPAVPEPLVANVEPLHLNSHACAKGVPLRTRAKPPVFARRALLAGTILLRR